MVKSIASKIDWYDGKNVTVKKVTKKQKNKKTGKTRNIQTEEEARSFFNFFRDTDSTEEHVQTITEEEVNFLIKADKEHELHHYYESIKDAILTEAIPYAV